jgi:hypothetical protein
MNRTHLLSVVLLVSGAALAQDPAPAAPPVEAPAAVPAPPAPVEGGAPAADQGRGTLPPPETYTVRPGDTLWDLSGRFLNNPWYWPKLWSYNPDIPNPHWIYPGSLLRFFPATEEGPARVAPVAEDAGGPEEEERAAPPALADVSRADLNGPVPEGDGVTVGGAHKIGFIPSRQLFIRHDAFVTPEEVDASGVIKAAFEEKLMLSTLDRAYATFKREAPVKKGETYVIYKTDRPIRHPVTKALLGYQTTVLGSAKVVAVDDRAATVTIVSTAEPIERGALLGPWTGKSLRPVERRPARADVDAQIVAAPIDVLTQYGEHQVVFIDRGTADGVEEGNAFSVVRAGDLYFRAPNEVSYDPSLPEEVVGELLVIDAREHTSAALVTRSMTELHVKDYARMRMTAGSGGR